MNAKEAALLRLKSGSCLSKTILLVPEASSQ